MEVITQLDPEVVMLVRNTREGFNYRFRRHDQWTENYTLYRDKVILNRLTQRQTVNVPLMKTGVRTLLKDVDDLPVMYFENLDNDKQAEVFKNEYWKYTGEQNKFGIQDILDKRQIFHYGRTYDSWQVINGKVVMGIEDPMDMLVSRYTDSSSIHSSRYVIQLHVFKPLSQLMKSPLYDKAVLARLYAFYQTKEGLVKAADNMNALVEKNQKMLEMGVFDIDHPVLGETYVELNLHFVFRDTEVSKGKTYEDQIFLYVLADDREILLKKPQEEIIGVTSDHFWQNHFRYNSWADDIDNQDWYTDGVADIIRTPNKILNAWISQLVENRSLKNLNMNLYDSSIENFVPQTWDPRAWGMYGVPVPGNKTLDQVFKQMEVSDLADSLDEISFLVEMTEKATGATANLQGAQNERQITLGEVKLSLSEAKERIKGMSKFYTQVWQERGLMFIKLLEAAGDKLDAVRVYKKGKNTSNIFSREIQASDWETKLGYQCRVWDQNERNEENMQSLEKISAIAMDFPGNPKMLEIKQRKELEFAGLTPDEINDVMAVEEQKQSMMASQSTIDPTTGQPTGPQMTPQNPQAAQLPMQQPMLPAQAGQTVQ